MKPAERLHEFPAPPTPGERDIFVYTVLSRATLPQENTVLMDLIADLFLDRYVEALHTSSGVLIAWIEETCARYPDKPLPQIFAGACNALADAFYVGSGKPQAGNPILALNGIILSHIMKPRLVPHFAAETLGETDIAADRWLAVLERADRITAEHSRSVAAWCARLGRALGLGAKEIAHLGRCGLLHDVGKLQTPAHILSAPRQLDDIEWQIMKKHSIEGESMLAADTALHELAAATRSHHERFDGSGYPDRLAGHEIPLAARVVAVADSFNAMIARRPYRIPVSPTLAMEELQRMSGTQFDPAIVGAMREVLAVS